MNEAKERIHILCIVLYEIKYLIVDEIHGNVIQSVCWYTSNNKFM